jgi:hypothetical protein
MVQPSEAKDVGKLEAQLEHEKAKLELEKKQAAAAQPDTEWEPQYVKVLTVLDAKVICRDILQKFETAEVVGQLKAAGEQVKRAGTAAAVQEFLMPIAVQVQSEVVAKHGFAGNIDGVKDFGMSVSRTIQRDQDQELYDMLQAMQQGVTKYAGKPPPAPKMPEPEPEPQPVAETDVSVGFEDVTDVSVDPPAKAALSAEAAPPVKAAALAKTAKAKAPAGKKKATGLKGGFLNSKSTTPKPKPTATNVAPPTGSGSNMDPATTAGEAAAPGAGAVTPCDGTERLSVWGGSDAPSGSADDTASATGESEAPVLSVWGGSTGAGAGADRASAAGGGGGACTGGGEGGGRLGVWGAAGGREDGAASAVQDNIQTKGQAAYYHAHAHPQDHAVPCAPQKISPIADTPTPPSAPKGKHPSASRGTTAAGHTYDTYQEKWSKFDVDGTLAEMDEEQASLEHAEAEEARQQRKATADAAQEEACYQAAAKQLEARTAAALQETGFAALPSFGGARAGCVFKSGDRGVGYYVDAPPPGPRVPSAASGLEAGAAVLQFIAPPSEDKWDAYCDDELL